jgi:hypothetical protein
VGVFCKMAAESSCAITASLTRHVTRVVLCIRQVFFSQTFSGIPCLHRQLEVIMRAQNVKVTEGSRGWHTSSSQVFQTVCRRRGTDPNPRIRGLLLPRLIRTNAVNPKSHLTLGLAQVQDMDDARVTPKIRGNLLASHPAPGV